MRVDLSVQHEGQLFDVAVDAPAGATVATVCAATTSWCGADQAHALWFAGVALPPDSAWSQVGLRTGAVITTAAPTSRPGPPAALSLSVVAGPCAGRTVPLVNGCLYIGRGAECDVVLDDPDTSRRHAAITIDRSGVAVRDLGSTNGTTLDGHAVSAVATPVGVGALIRIGENTLSVTGPHGAPAVTTPCGDGTVRVLRPPRRATALPRSTIRMPVAGSTSGPHRVQWITALLPAAAGGVMVWATGSAMFLLFALLSPVMVLSGALGDRLHWRRSRRRGAATFAADSARATEAITAALAEEVRVRRLRAPDPAVIAAIASLPGDRLWERTRGGDDLLVVRLGTGEVPSTTTAERDGHPEPAGMLADTAICIDLREGPLGLAGAGVEGSARWVLAQLATFLSPADTEFALMLTTSTDQHWRWARWLPHLSTRVVGPSAWGEVVDELTDRLRLLPSSSRAAARWTGRWTVLVIDQGDQSDPSDDVAGLAALLQDGPSIGVTALVLTRDPAALPSVCASVATVDGERASRLTLRQHGAMTARDIVADRVGPEWAEELARSLAPMLDSAPSDTTTLPADCTLEDVHGRLDAESVAARWATSAGLARAALGAGIDGPFVLDLASEGPHALIAGTTGSGKSELLQALVVGLALDQPPEELNLLLIDYKGGAAFSDCARLPHTAGIVTDLDPYLTSRALRSLRSELRRRETLLAAVGAADLPAYRRARSATVIARLVIVVDEFAALAQELPDFVQGLVAIAQRGRSLGVHLVLATQRPGSAVSGEIRANTAVRIALRVTDAAESSDVVDVPDAAHIPRSRAGRAYVRTGSTLRAIQAAWPGAHTTSASDDVRVELLDHWRRPRAQARAHDEDQVCDLRRLVDVITHAAALRGSARAGAPWTAPLPETLDRGALPISQRPTSVVFGLADLADEQRREPVGLDLEAAESLLIVGASRSGRTNVLSSIAIGAASQLPPGELEIYVVDPSGSLQAAVSGLPHTATVVDGQDPDLVLRLLGRLEHDCVERARDAGSPVRRLLLVDGWDTLTAALADLEAAQRTEHLTRVLRVAPGGGLSVVVAGDRSLLTPRVAGGFSRRLALQLADVSDYAAFGLTPREVPSPMPPGRAVRAEDATVLQIAVAASASATVIASRWSGSALSPNAIRLRSLPASVRFSTLTRDPDHQAPTVPRALLLGLAGDDASPLALDLAAHPGHLIVAGPPRSGRSTVLRLLYRQARSARLNTIVAAGPHSPLTYEARADGVTVLDPAGDPDSPPPPDAFPTLLLVDDSELWVDSALGDTISQWLPAAGPGLSAVVAGRSDDLATAYRGVAAQARRSQRGILLRPGPIDGELLGIRLPRRPSSGPPGRGVMIGDPRWDRRFRSGDPLPLQIAQLEDLGPDGTDRGW